MATELTQRDQYLLASQVIENALERHPHNVDLLASGIRYHATLGNYTRCEEIYALLKQIDLSEWNWRAFVFVSDYLEMIGRIAEFIEVCQRFQTVIPDDERAYSQIGTYYSKLGRYHQAIEVLERGMAAVRRSAQCALSLSQSYMELGEYDKAVGAADRALEATADEQPSANQASVLWHRALALDAWIHRDLQTRDTDGTGKSLDPELLWRVRQCIIDYRTAAGMPDAFEIFRRRAAVRLEILKSLLLRHGLPDEDAATMFAAPGLDAERLQMLEELLEKHRKTPEESEEDASGDESNE